MINRFRKNNYVLLLLTKVLTKHMLITGQSHIKNQQCNREKRKRQILCHSKYKNHC